MAKKKKEGAEAAPEEVTRKHGKTGVMAKIAGIKEQVRENADAVNVVILISKLTVQRFKLPILFLRQRFQLDRQHN